MKRLLGKLAPGKGRQRIKGARSDGLMDQSHTDTLGMREPHGTQSQVVAVQRAEECGNETARRERPSQIPQPAKAHSRPASPRTHYRESPTTRVSAREEGILKSTGDKDTCRPGPTTNKRERPCHSPSLVANHSQTQKKSLQVKTGSAERHTREKGSNGLSEPSRASENEPLRSNSHPGPSAQPEVDPSRMSSSRNDAPMQVPRLTHIPKPRKQPRQCNTTTALVNSPAISQGSSQYNAHQCDQASLALNGDSVSDPVRTGGSVNTMQKPNGSANTLGVGSPAPCGRTAPAVGAASNESKSQQLKAQFVSPLARQGSRPQQRTEPVRAEPTRWVNWPMSEETVRDEQTPDPTNPDLSPTFRTLLGAPLPAWPWHPGPSPRRTPITDPPPHNCRPISQPTRACRKSPEPSPPASIIHYHVTIQNADGLDVNIKPLNKAGLEDPKGIVAKTVFTADGRQLKRLSWIEVSPMSEDEQERLTTDTAGIVGEKSSAIEIGSMAIGIDKVWPESENMESEVYFSEEAERMFADHNQVIIAASSPLTNRKTTVIQHSKPPNLMDGDSVKDPACSPSEGLMEKNMGIKHKSDFPWHSKQSGSLSSRSEDCGSGNSMVRQVSPCTDIDVGSSSKAILASTEGESAKKPVLPPPRPTFKPGQKRASEETLRKVTDPQGAQEGVAAPHERHSTRKRDRRRRTSKNTESKEDIEAKASMSTNKLSGAQPESVKGGGYVSRAKKQDNSEINVGPGIDASTSTRAIMAEPTYNSIWTQTDAVAGSMTVTDTLGRLGVDYPIPEHCFICTECRNLRRSPPTGACGHSIPSDIVAKRKVAFEKQGNSDLSVVTDAVIVDNDVTAMRLGPQTTFFRNAQCQTISPGASELKSAAKRDGKGDVLSRGSRPIGRVAPCIRRSASVQSGHTPWDGRDALAERAVGLQRHWSLSSVDIDTHPALNTHLSTTNSLEWETTSVDTDILTLETDRTLQETERTLREVELSIQESRNTSLALRRVRMQAEVHAPVARRPPGVTSMDAAAILERQATGSQIPLESEARVAQISPRFQARSIAQDLANQEAGSMPSTSLTAQLAETTCDKLTRIRGNLIRVPGVLILGLKAGKIAVTMSPDRPHFEPIDCFMRENRVSLSEYECAVLAQRYRSPRIGSATFIHQPITSSLLVR